MSSLKIVMGRTLSQLQCVFYLIQEVFNVACVKTPFLQASDVSDGLSQ